MARRLVTRRLRGLPYLDEDGLTFAQRAEGEPHVWPRAWIVSGRALDHETTKARLAAWRNGLHDPGERRCGVAIAYAEDGSEVVAAVAIDALADLAPLPIRTHAHEPLNVDATLRIPAHSARVILTSPDGSPRALPTTIEQGHVRAHFTADHAGEIAVQVIADVGAGPRPILEARVYADVEPPESTPNLIAEGEDAGKATTDEPLALTAMIAAVREAEKLGPLARDARLDAIAATQARKMMTSGSVGHDLGDGDPTDRMAAAGLSARVTGENVAHAQSVQLAHRALWASPSHRANLVRRGFDRLGIAVVDDPDGSVWVTEVFAGGLHAARRPSF